VDTSNDNSFVTHSVAFFTSSSIPMISIVSNASTMVAPVFAFPKMLFECLSVLLHDAWR
jgi:hypothetical protein